MLCSVCACNGCRPLYLESNMFVFVCGLLGWEGCGLVLTMFGVGVVKWSRVCVLPCQNPVCKRSNLVVNVCLLAGKLWIGIGFVKEVYGECFCRGSSATSQIRTRTWNNVNVWCVVHDELVVGFWNCSQALDPSHVGSLQTLKYACKFRPQNIQRRSIT